MIFVATKNGMTKKFSPLLSWTCCWIQDPGSEIRDPGWIKIRIQDPGSATLWKRQVLTGTPYRYRSYYWFLKEIISSKLCTWILSRPEKAASSLMRWSSSWLGLMEKAVSTHSLHSIPLLLTLKFSWGCLVYLLHDCVFSLRYFTSVAKPEPEP